MVLDERLRRLEELYDGYFCKGRIKSTPFIEFYTSSSLTFLQYVHIKTVLEFDGYSLEEIQSLDDELVLGFVKK